MKSLCCQAHRTWVAFAAILMAAAWAAFASEIDYTGPGRLSEMISQSDFIVVASCTHVQPVEGSVYTLQFAVHKQIKGKLDSFSLELASRLSPVFGILSSPNSSLVFLKRGPDGKPKLTTSISVVPLNAQDAGLPAIISKKLEIDAMPAGEQRNTALKHLILPLLAAGGGDSYTKESMAEDLLDLCRDHGARLSGPELAFVSRVAAGTDAYKVALPLSLVLDQQNDPRADEVSLHVLLDTDALTKDNMFRLSPTLARRPKLREQFVEKIEQTQDPAKLSAMLAHLYKVDPTTQNAIYERVWRNNAAARPHIKHILTHSGVPEHAQLLQRLNDEPAPKQ